MTWNNGSDYCSHCNTLLNSEMIREIENEQKKVALANRPSSKIDIFISEVKNSNNILVKGIYYVFHSIWFVFVSIVTFLMAFVALGPG